MDIDLPLNGAMSIMNLMALQHHSSHSTFGQASDLGVEKMNTRPSDSGYTELCVNPHLWLFQIHAIGIPF